MNDTYDVIIIGAGAAGLFCAFNAAQRNKRVLVLDHANKVGKKILMSGGGRCNFTNLFTSHEDFFSSNPHFCKSALSQYSAYEFLSLVEKHNIEYVEKAAGQLFCKNSSKDILNLLLKECADAGVKIYKKCAINKINNEDDFKLDTSCGYYQSTSLVIATGGLSIPTLGATGFGYEIAEKFGHEIKKTKAALVPFTLNKKQLEKYKELSGVALRVNIELLKSGVKKTITDDLLFTHRGLSGPAVLKISPYWEYGEEVKINLLPDQVIEDYLEEQKKQHGEQLITNNLSNILPRRLAAVICDREFKDKKIKQLSKRDIENIKVRIHEWKVTPSGTEGYRTAEVTLGGIDTSDVSSKTFESKLVKNLYFIGEVLDVTGQLGGYNFQWAWASAWCASQHV